MDMMDELGRRLQIMKENIEQNKINKNMAKFKGAIVIDIEKCKGCGLCVEVCPQNVIALGNNVNTKGYFYADVIKEDCTACENCVMVCPDTVITLYKAKVEV